ncbi:MAG: methylmalonyl Co-A mutase-associated GTPase MeaB [Cyclobacteriaceae bacterium]|nr:methylmalonyl Co-A mutase-associated GTPase MeaB [Cyclobacteriaceae bacterium]
MRNTGVQLLPADIAEQIIAGNRVVLAQAITLAESQRPQDVTLAHQLITTLLPNTGKSVRIGITGVPGVGKSTFIEAFGTWLTSQQKKIAVLAVDPSSSKTKGSILGDKTRMEKLARNPNAFIRPTPTGNTLGGVANRTRETILLCEAAGFDVILVETVGVGQSETTVRNMVDFFLLLLLAGAGDELQGIKKGIMEMADAVVITKADGENKKAAALACANYQQALHLFNAADSGWQPKVLTSSATENTGIAETWQLVQDYMEHVQTTGYLEKYRQAQNRNWFYESIQTQLLQKIALSEKVNANLARFESEIMNNTLLPSEAARQLLTEVFRGSI